MSGPHSIVDNPGGAAAPAAQVVPATVVVANLRGDFLLTEAGINAAIAAINAAGGGTIYLGEGTVAPAAPFTTITAPCKIVGAGRRATVIVPAAGINVFSVGAVSVYFSDFHVTGDEDTDQRLFVLTASVTQSQTDWFVVERVTIGNAIGVGVGRIKTVFDCAGFIRVFSVKDCTFNVRSASDGANSRLIRDGASATFYMNDVIALFGSAINACGVLNAKNCTIATALSGITISTAILVNSQISASGQTVTFSGGSNRVVSSSVVATTFTVAGSAQIDDSSIAVTTLNANADSVKIQNSQFLGTFSTSGFNNHVLRDNFMVSMGAPNVLLDDSTGCVVEGNTDCEVAESGTSDNNRYTKIASASVIIGPSSIVEGAKKTQVTGAATPAAFTAVAGFPRTSVKGMVGIGTIKNTGANAMEVREVVTDAFGVTVTTSPVVSIPAGGDYMLDPQTNFTDGVLNARPPYLSYSVEVRHPGAATTYDLQFTAQGTVI